MKIHIVIVLLCVTLSGCAFFEMLFTPPTDPVTEEVTGDSPAVELAKQFLPEPTEGSSSNSMNWRELALYGVITAQNTWLANKKRKQLAAAKKRKQLAASKKTEAGTGSFSTPS